VKICKFIEIKNLSYSFRENSIFLKANLNLDKSSITFLIGPNGSGKTTLSKIILGIINVEDKNGSIIIDGQSIKNINLSDVGKKIGYLFQNPDKQLFNPTVKDELNFYQEYRNLNIDNDINVINLFNLEKIMENKVVNLSEGEKKRLALACILQMHPQYLILDEPTTGLDYKNKNILIRILKELKASYSIGSLIISHDSDFIGNLSNRKITIKDRKIQDV